MNHLESFVGLLNEGCEDFQQHKQRSDALNKLSKTLKRSMRENIVEFQFELQKHMVSWMKNTDDLEFVLYVNQCQDFTQNLKNFHDRWQMYQDLRTSTNDEMTQE